MIVPDDTKITGHINFYVEKKKKKKFTERILSNALSK